MKRTKPSRAALARHSLAAALVAVAGLLHPGAVREASADDATDAMAAKINHLIAAYPDQHLRQEGNDLIWPDGTRMPIDDGKGDKPFEAWIADPDIADMLRLSYPAGTDAQSPAKDFDPGRARNQPFFAKMYGDCRTGSVKAKLRAIAWLPKKSGQRVEITTVNGVAEKLEAVSKELDELPASFDKYLFPIGGTFNCRAIAGTGRPSAHGLGIAIDIATKHTSYWHWAAPGAGGTYTYKNEIPPEIVRAFERHGFIWGGRWYHYDTMHFEYRPELLPASGAAP